MRGPFRPLVAAAPFAVLVVAVFAVAAFALAAAADNPLSGILAFVAVVFAGANVVGGYWVTDRMLQMFKRRPVPKADEPAE